MFASFGGWILICCLTWLVCFGVGLITWSWFVAMVVCVWLLCEFVVLDCCFVVIVWLFVAGYLAGFDSCNNVIRGVYSTVDLDLFTVCFGFCLRVAFWVGWFAAVCTTGCSLELWFWFCLLLWMWLLYWFNWFRWLV